MASISPTNFVALIHCDACGDVHAVNFCNEAEFNKLRCAVENAPIFCTRQDYHKVYRQVQGDLVKHAVTV